MNINVSIDCTPEEARRFMGLPDMAPLHALYLDKLKSGMSEGMSPELVDSLVRSWMPMGEMGMNAWKQVVDQLSGLGSTPQRG